MAFSRLRHPAEGEYELTGRNSWSGSSSEEEDGDEGVFDLDYADSRAGILSGSGERRRGRGKQWPWTGVLSLLQTLQTPFSRARRRGTGGGRRRRKKQPAQRAPRQRRCVRRRGCRHITFLGAGAFGVVALLVTLTSIFNPSYTHPPERYGQLRYDAMESGRANPREEKVYIAANIIDEDLIRGAWGSAVLGLIDLLGEKNVFLSVYENDSGEGTEKALKEFKERVNCKSSIVSEHLPLEDVGTVELPNGEKRIKRVAYLAEVRNRALKPLDHPKDHGIEDVKFDKLLFVNDIVFSPLEAAQLLFATNADEKGTAQYRAACSVDFINPFKFYDTFASRDLEGYSMGVPFFPWFARVGAAKSRQAVLQGKDAVPVRSCWGGMVAFDAKFFQGPKSAKDRNLNWSLKGDRAPEARAEPATTPVRFRAESDVFWDASECCLIHADIQPTRDPSDLQADSGIYVNPFIRVAYDERTFGWLGVTRRWERLYSHIHHLVNLIASMPVSNPRRAERVGEEVTEKVWVYTDPNWQEDKEASTKKTKGSYQELQRTATAGGFCGTRKLQVLKKNPKEGEKKWESLPVPPV